MRSLGEKRNATNDALNELKRTPGIGNEIPVQLSDYQEFIKAMAILWIDPMSNSELKRRSLKS